ncbi:MAG: flagellar protein FlaG [Caldimicrobium sp.]
MNIKTVFLTKINLPEVRVNERKDLPFPKISKESKPPNVQEEDLITLTDTLKQAEQDNKKEYKYFLERINETLLSINKALKIEIDEELKIPIYKIIDLRTKEVLKQIPLEDILKFKKALAQFLEKELGGKEKVIGLLLKKEA